MSEKKTFLSIKAPALLRGEALLPSSKSLSNRALIINALMQSSSPTNKECQIDFLAECDDTAVMQRALVNPDVPEVDIMAAGTAMRFLTAYYACTAGQRIITGTARMRQRPISVLVEALRSLGADITYIENEGFPPLFIRGKSLSGRDVSLAGNVSSQYISALLLIAPILPHGLRLTLTGDVVSRSYITMTLSLMASFGAKAEWEDESTVVVQALPYHRTKPFAIEGDWSAASYWYEMLALSPDAEAHIVIPRLYKESLQGDRAVADYFALLGVSTTWTSEGVLLTKTKCTIQFFEVDLTLQPDIAQTLIVTLCALNVPFCVSGLQTLRIKETDRIAALQTELAKFGYHITEPTPGTLAWNGEVNHTTSAYPITVATYDDHRMAMAFAPLALVLNAPLHIADPDVVTKSYPEYWDALRALGFVCE